MEVPRFWRTNDERYKLEGDQCPHCDEKHFPPRDVCSGCGGTKDEDVNTPDSHKITTPGYNGTFRIRYAAQEVQSYSEMMHPEVDVEKIAIDIPAIETKAIQIEVPSGIIYQDTGVAA
mgnify:CR=1 FL=1